MGKRLRNRMKSGDRYGAIQREGFVMYDRDTAMLDQYDLTVKNIRKVRSGWLCMAQEGTFLWKETSSGEDRLSLENAVCQEIERLGLTESWRAAGGDGSLRMDRFVKNREGYFLTEDHYGRCFILKKWTEGRECEVRTLADLYNGAKAAACMHQSMRRIKLDDLEKVLVQEKKLKADTACTDKMNESLTEGKACTEGMNESLTEGKVCTERMNESLAEDKACIQKMNRSLTRSEEDAKQKNDREPVTIAHLASGEPCMELWLRRKKEITRVQSYIRRRKNKNALEQLIMKETPYFAEQADTAIGMLGEISGRLENQVCHGDFHYHNLIYSPEENWICQSSRFHLGPQIMDFYLFLRKCMEKQNWDWGLAENLLTIYRQDCPVKSEELQFLYCLFLFPEKYWKQLNFYIQSNKAWMPEKNVVKLRNVIELEAKRQVFLENFRRILA